VLRRVQIVAGAVGMASEAGGRLVGVYSRITHPSMSLSTGFRIGVYEVTGAIGRGGMGEVYRAHDARLGRDVALKVLPDSFVHDADRLARFRREAHVLASFSHSNIATIHGLEESGGVTALVMELVEGDDLSTLIARGLPEAASVSAWPRDSAGEAESEGGAPKDAPKPSASARALSDSASAAERRGPAATERRRRGLPLDDALSIARQIAEALAAAHDQGIVHRDLKPANVKVRADGTVKLLDFGLAKAMDPGVGQGGATAPSLSMSPTITSPAMTQMGLILGTAAYMSPEQARGRGVDRRADIWAFGVTLYEMVTGRRLFEGEDLTETLAAVVLKPADVSSAPVELRRLLSKCLEKDPKKRLQHIGDWELLLDFGPEASRREAVVRRSALWPWLAAAAAAGAVLVATGLYLSRQPPAPPLVYEFSLDLPATALGSTYSLSPDGRHVALSIVGRGGGGGGEGGGQSRLLVRPLGSGQVRDLPGTEGARYPFWSPDSRFIAFFAGGRLKKVAIDGGPAQSVAEAEDGRGGTWNADGVILFAPAPFGQIMRVADAGGEATPVTGAGESDTRPARRFPWFLPDGRHFLYTDSAIDSGSVGVYVGSVDGGPARRLLADDTNAVFAPAADGSTGDLLFVREETLMAQPFDAARLELVGTARLVVESIGQSGNQGSYGLSVSHTGSLMYTRGAGLTDSGQLVWVNASGETLRTIGRPARFLHIALAPDETRAALSIAERGDSDIWLLDLARDGMTRLTSHPGADLLPKWSADGRSIAFIAERGSAGTLFVADADGAGGQRPILPPQGNRINLTDWSSDGRFFLYSHQRPRTGADLLVLSSEPDATPEAYLATEFAESGARFSPDGHWVAYVSNEDGASAVYVRAFPQADRKVRISTEGGQAPRWSRDGRTLYYWTLGPERTLTAVPITVTDVVSPGRAQSLFTRTLPVVPAYEVSRDGRFLMALPIGDGRAEALGTAAGARQFVFVSDWRR
jgi:serine/threonine protein kinase/Tol biopolymer transport system component